MISAKGLPGSQSVADPEFPGGGMIHIPGTAEPEARSAPAHSRRPCWGWVQGGGRPLPPRGSGDITPGKFLTFCKKNPAFWCTSKREIVNVCIARKM
jgi:hypothetical protein